MITIILIVTIGILFSVFATQNTATIDILLGSQMISEVPLYLIVLASICVGILTVGLYHMLQWISLTITMGHKNKEITDYRKDINNLTKDVHKLELENAKLKTKLNIEEDFDEDSI